MPDASNEPEQHLHIFLCAEAKSDAEEVPDANASADMPDSNACIGMAIVLGIKGNDYRVHTFSELCGDQSHAPENDPDRITLYSGSNV